MDASFSPEKREEIAVCQAVFYSLFQVGMTAMIVLVCMYQTARGKWGIMIAFSISVSVDYVAQVVQSVSTATKHVGYLADIAFTVSSAGLFSAFVIYCYLIAAHVRPSLIRKRMKIMAYVHTYSVLLPVTVALIYMSLLVYYYFFSREVEQEYTKYLDLLMHILIAIIAIWNMFLKRKYHRKYLKTKCYSWTVTLFFTLDAVLTVIDKSFYDGSYHMFIFRSCVDLYTDLCPLMAFIYFALYSKTSASPVVLASGRDESMTSSILIYQ
ncbi:MAG: hypothetical protein P4M11_11030 [Candidatus Pacebacteria bacterium]|nr:hypothetical protein [Candidatus Paceibacterota bacterium]